MTPAYDNVFVVYDCTVMRLCGRRELGSTFIEVLGRYAQTLGEHEGKLMLSGVSDLLKEQWSAPSAVPS